MQTKPILKSTFLLFVFIRLISPNYGQQVTSDKELVMTVIEKKDMSQERGYLIDLKADSIHIFNPYDSAFYHYALPQINRASFKKTGSFSKGAWSGFAIAESAAVLTMFGNIQRFGESDLYNAPFHMILTSLILCPPSCLIGGLIGGASTTRIEASDEELYELSSSVLNQYTIGKKDIKITNGQLRRLKRLDYSMWPQMNALKYTPRVYLKPLHLGYFHQTIFEEFKSLARAAGDPYKTSAYSELALSYGLGISLWPRWELNYTRSITGKEELVISMLQNENDLYFVNTVQSIAQRLEVLYRVFHYKNGYHGPWQWSVGAGVSTMKIEHAAELNSQTEISTYQQSHNLLGFSVTNSLSYFVNKHLSLNLEINYSFYNQLTTRELKVGTPTPFGISGASFHPQNISLLSGFRIQF